MGHLDQTLGTLSLKRSQNSADPDFSFIVPMKEIFFQNALKLFLEGIFRRDFLTRSTHRDTSIAHVFMMISDGMGHPIPLWTFSGGPAEFWILFKGPCPRRSSVLHKTRLAELIKCDLSPSSAAVISSCSTVSKYSTCEYY